jgi:hypothetical protein
LVYIIAYGLGTGALLLVEDERPLVIDLLLVLEVLLAVAETEGRDAHAVVYSQELHQFGAHAVLVL